jgi:lipopolysaccharide transport system permease protein
VQFACSAKVSQIVADVREMLGEQVEYRELLYQMTRRDLLLRYKQTAVGFAWAIFMPLVNTALFSVIFTRVAPIDVGMPYPLFAFCGLLAWNFSASSFRFALTSLTSNTNLVTKVYFPREIFPFSALFVALIDFLTGSVALLALLIYYQVPMSWAIAALPLVVLAHVMFTASVCLLLAMANLFYRDVKYLFEVLVTVWMFTTAVLYPVANLSSRFGLMLQLNPLTPIIDGYRSVLIRGTLPDAGPFAVAGVMSVLLLALSWLLFHRAEFRFAENV